MCVFSWTISSFNLEVEKMFTSKQKLKYLFCLNLDPQIKFSQTCVKKFSTFLDLNILKNDHDFRFSQLQLICEQFLNKFSKKRVSMLFWVRLKLHKLFWIYLQNAFTTTEMKRQRWQTRRSSNYLIFNLFSNKAMIAFKPPLYCSHVKLLSFHRVWWTQL